MKFSCDQQKLSKALNIVSRAVTSRTTMPVLKGILLEVRDGKLTMSASDLDVSIQNTIDVDSPEDGSVIVMAKLFGDIIRKLPSTEVNVVCDDEYNVTVKCMNSNFKIMGMSTDEFPSINTLEEESRFAEFDKDVLRSMIEKTAFAASVDESRGVITGVLIEMENDQVNMVAIDGYRMAINRRNKVNPQQKKIIVSARTLTDIGRILGETDSSEKTGTLYLSSKKAVLRMDNVQAEMKLMEGEFIGYRDIIPGESKIIMTVNRGMLLESIERASLLSRAGKNNLIRMNIQDTILTLTSNSDEGNVREEIPVTKEGEDLTIGFNAQYVIDVLKAVEDDEVKMLFNTPVNPCLIQPLSGDEYEYLVLPVRIN
ncbi:DNA polymerase III subunit beta [Hornefia porci]|uniref:Beta sliding clamp n=1 Tax=Hornefia porci TaxID=2652292 RepID=A0A1Q9JIN0_9FIRM|nr:DNA polymerase III subunit beta [Hornefia porci]OLR56068.1 DNA polymerase III subunit beta [Hornefia porci]